MSNDLILLSDVCTEYFGLSERIAQRKANLGLLPVPAFRISGTRKGAFYILKSDYAAMVEKAIFDAQPENFQRPPQKPKKENVRTDLYRHFDKDGILLYVGISNSTLARLRAHKSASHWSNNIARVEIEQYDSSEAAYYAETIAIQKEKPLHNLAKVLK